VNHTQPENTALAVAGPRQQFDLSPQNFEQALVFADYLADSEMVPKDFKGKPGNCLIAMQWGAELGLKPLQALQNLAVINGRPSLWGDAVLALVLSSPACEYVRESDDGETATCRVKRRGDAEHVVTFSMGDAKTAGLVGKQGPWTQYPKRMRQMRARAFALRDKFADVLKGIAIAEEQVDMAAPRDMGMADVVKQEIPTTYPADKFTENLPAWRKVISDGRKTADQIITMAETKHPLTEAQKAAIRAPAEAAAKAEPTPPTYAEVADKLHAAKNQDQLNDAADLIGSVAAPDQRTDLTAIYDSRLAELTV